MIKPVPKIDPESYTPDYEKLFPKDQAEKLKPAELEKAKTLEEYQQHWLAVLTELERLRKMK